MEKYISSMLYTLSLERKLFYCNMPYLYSRYRTGTGLQPRLMQRVFLNANHINLVLVIFPAWVSLLQASSTESYRTVYSRVQQPCKFIGTKESVYIRKELNSHWIGLVQQHGKRKCLNKKRVELPQDCIGKPTWQPFHCFGTPIWLAWRNLQMLQTKNTKMAYLHVEEGGALCTNVTKQLQSSQSEEIP